MHSVHAGSERKRIGMSKINLLIRRVTLIEDILRILTASDSIQSDRASGYPS